MDRISTKILSVFHELKVGKEDIIPLQSLDSKIRDWDIDETMRFANGLAAIVISRPRAVGYPLLSEVEEYLRANG